MSLISVLVVCFSMAAGCLANDCGKDVIDRLAALENQIVDHQREIAELKSPKKQQETETRNKRALQADGRIAFTAYMRQDLNHLARNTTVIYDAVLINHGNGYDNSTGYFTAPIPGVYFFTYTVGQQGVNQINTKLTLNDRHYVDGVSEGISDHHDVQSGNAGVVRLSTGDVVSVKHRLVGNHIEGSNSLRLTTFSGFLLYNVEDIDVVMG